MQNRKGVQILIILTVDNTAPMLKDLRNLLDAMLFNAVDTLLPVLETAQRCCGYYNPGEKHYQKKHSKILNFKIFVALC